MNAKTSAAEAKLIPAIGTSITNEAATAMAADIDRAMSDPSLARIDSAMRADIRRPAPEPRPEPEIVAEPEPNPVLTPRPRFIRA